MNIKKFISVAGYTMLQPVSFLCKMQKSKMITEEAHRILASVYAIDKDDLDFIGGGKRAPRLLSDSLNVSFVIPVYNSERFLERCVRSILCQQTSARYEVICINDGSTDGSLRILERLQSEFPELLRVVSQDNQGISVTRNRGIELAKGEYIGFLDNDDYVSEGYVETLWQRRLETDADMIQIGHLVVNVEGKELSRSTHPDMFIDDDQSEIQENVSGYVWSGIHRKRVFENLRFPVGFWYEDMITKMLLSRLCKKFAFVHECLYCKTVHANNASLKLWNGSNSKCIDHLFLVTKFAEYGTQTLHLDNSELGLNVLNELRLLWQRTKGMNLPVREAVFVMGSDLLRRYPVNASSVATRQMRRYAKDFLNGYYWKWEVDGWIGLFEDHFF